jgi:putative hydroxymethylpyrimidine transporter CytX
VAAIAREIEIHEDITPVPDEDRRLGALDIGVLWGDLGVGLLVLVAGSLLVPGLGLRAALLATLVGSVIGSALLAIAGRVGSDTGVPTMVALRPSLGIRGSYLASLKNLGQLLGWAGVEIIIMAQAARAISDEFFGFEGYYLWLTLFAVIATAMAVGGPIVVVREFLQRFGFWIVVAATIWLTVRLFTTYDVQDLLDDKGAGGWPNFWQGVDLAVSLPVSWLPLVADYSRYARRSGGAAVSTFVSYTIANTWFFARGASYVLVLASDPGSLIGALVDSVLGLTLGWLFLLVILTDEADNAFANVYSTAVSIQNLVRFNQRALAVLVGVAAFVLAVSLDLLGYETFLLLIGGIFVSLFGVMLADYFVVHRQRYDTGELYRGEGAYWFFGGVNAAGILAWAAGFATYIVCGQPPWVLEHFSRIADVPSRLTEIGGTIPSFAVSLAAYLLLQRAQARWLPTPTRPGDKLHLAVLPPDATDEEIQAFVDELNRDRRA